MLLKKRYFKIYLAVFLFLICCIFSSGQSFAQNKINLLVDVRPSLALIVSDSSVDFGVLIAGSPQTGGHGVKVAVSTNSANGYYLSAADNTEASNSSLLNRDGLTHIADFAASCSSPQPYLTNQSKGLGITVYSATSSKENKWGNGESYNDTRNQYCGVPELFTVIHQAIGYKDYVDYSDIGFILDVPSNQKTGEYSGSIVLSAVAMLN